ncbi:MAG TPA: alpha/beta hydrolase-fold protein [Saprospiraceae bacterium]|nr:alpha/beta hydrolase-fold protein [Saprospiraceae bacterium]
MKNEKHLFIFFILVYFFTACKQKIEYSHNIKSENGELIVQFRGDVDFVKFQMFQGIEGELLKKSNNLFENKFKISNLDSAIFSYEFVVSKYDTTKNLVPINYKSPTDNGFFIFGGKLRKIDYPKSKSLAGKVITEELTSKYLIEPRKLSIYKPLSYDENTPIIYFTDGQVVEEYASYVDTLIKENKILPFILVGVYSSDDLRNEEYIENHNRNENFLRHQSFFYEDVLEYVEKGIANWQGKRYIHGFSNGGAFCMHAGINYPNMFEEVITFSTVGYISEYIKPIEFSEKFYPKFYIGAGIYEESVYRENIKFVQKMRSNNISTTFKSFISSHDFSPWKIEFFEYILDRFKF